ncbi:MAG: hypothetical protein E6Q97_12935 [Desulfurellales bacterium]|nr:MAG: hypothetical protein E6Q97_12935 [Desulfurellales bacterium]
MAEYHSQYLTHCLRKDIAYNSAASGTAVLIGTLPKGAVVMSTTVAIKVAFNAGTSNDIIVGTSGDPDALVATGGVTETSVAATRVAPATLAGNVAASADTPLYVTYTQSGTAASAGTASIMVEYALDPTKYL